MRERRTKEPSAWGSRGLTAILIVCVVLLSVLLGVLLHQLKQPEQTALPEQSLEELWVEDETTELEETPAEEQPDEPEIPTEEEEPADTEETPEQTETPEAESEEVDQEETEPETTEPPAETESNTIEAQAAAILAEMTLEERIYQMFIVTPEQLTGVGTVIAAGETTRQALETHPVGGLIYMGANIQDPTQVTEMIANTQSYSKLGMFISVDEEGGRVARLGSNSAMGTTSYPAMQTVGESGKEAAYEAGLTIGSDIKQFGFNLDFAPVADVRSNPANTVVGDRAFSTDAFEAAELVASAVRGFNDSGVLCTLKHFPGHGDTEADSHNGMAVSNKTVEELQACEFLPFRTGIQAGADMVMIGHISLPNVTGDQTPATMSKTIVTDLLRDELGFDGVVITDAMNMGAITNYYSSGEAAVAAVQAGIDIILAPGSLTSAVSGLQAAVESGTLTEERINESVIRILMLKLEQGIITTE